jgi:competence protein ComEC
MSRLTAFATRNLVPALVAFLCGVALHDFISFPLALSAGLFLSAAVLFLFGLFRSRVFSMGMFALLLIFTAFGILRPEFSSPVRIPELDARVGMRSVMEGTIAEEPDTRADHVNLTLRELALKTGSTTQSIHGSVLVFVPRFPEYAYGDRVEVSGILQLPKSIASDDGLRTFDYPSYLAKDNIGYQLFRPGVKLLSSGEGNVLVSLLFKVKHAFIARLADAVPEPENALLAGLLLGDKRSLGDTWTERFRATGLAHIVVLSGYNMTIVAEWLATMFRFLGFFARIGAGALGIIFFALMVGGGATVIRAAAMALLVLLARATGRTATMARMLALAAGVMVLLNPRILLHDPSFQLSFLASLGLILVAPIIERRLVFLEKYPKIKEIVVATIATQVLVLPLLLYQTGLFSFVALPANLLVLPFVPLAMLLGLLAGVVSAFLSPLALLAGFPVYAVLAYILSIVEFFAELSFASATIGAFPLWVLLLSYALIGIMIWRSRRLQPHEESPAN